MVTNEREIEDRDLLAMLPLYVDLRERETSAKEEKERIGKPIRKYLEEHPGETLYDGESDIEGRLQRRSSAPQYDLLSLFEREPELFKRLLHSGCLRADHGLIVKQGAQLGGIARYAFPHGETFVLDVKRGRA